MQIIQHKTDYSDSSVIKYKVGSTKFQIFVKKGSLKDIESGKTPVLKVTLIDSVFLDNGDAASEEILQSSFGTTKISDIIERIAKEGEPQYSVQERREMVEQKRKQIIEHLHKGYIDPVTKMAHPLMRIENAMETIKGLQIDPHASTQTQADEIIKKLRGTLGFLKNETHGYLHVPIEYSGKITKVIHKYCTIRREKYGMEYKADISFPTTEYGSFCNELTNVTEGNYRFEDHSNTVAKPTNGGEGGSENEKGGSKKKGKK